MPIFLRSRQALIPEISEPALPAPGSEERDFQAGEATQDVVMHARHFHLPGMLLPDSAIDGIVVGDDVFEVGKPETNLVR